MGARGYYLAATAITFTLLVAIESRISGGFVRFTVGDFVVVMFLYAALMALQLVKPVVAAWLVLAFAMMVETSQALGVVEVFGLPDSRLTRAVLGNVFSWIDIAAYSSGLVVALVIDIAIRRMSASGDVDTWRS